MDSTLHNKLAQRAVKHNARGARVASWRLGLSSGALLGYLFWRNRYPVLTRLISRGFLFLELYLLLSLYHTRAAAALSGLLFFLYLCQQLFQGCVQQFRVHIAASLQGRNLERAEELVRSLAVLGVFFGSALAALAFSGVLLFSDNSLFIFLAALLLIVVPVQLWSSSLWSAVYVFHRLPRNFWVIVLLRAIPSLTLILLAGVFGPLLYGVAVTVARLLEGVYLGDLARKALNKYFKRSDTEEAVSRFRLVWPGSVPEFIERVVFYAAPAVYSAAVAGALLLTHDFYWVTYFTFFYLAITLLYIPLRLPQSLAMDVYLCLRRGSIFMAARFLRLSAVVATIALLLLICVFAAVVVLLSGYLIFQAPFLWKLSGYMFLILLARGVYGVAFIALRAACLERLIIWPHTAMFMCAAVLQLWAIVAYEADINFVLLIEAVVHLSAAALLFYARGRFQESPLLTGVLQKVATREIATPLLWLRSVTNRSSAAGHFGLIQIDPGYRSRAAEERLALLLKSRLPQLQFAFVRACPGYLLFNISAAMEPRDFEAQCLLACPGMVRSACLFAARAPEEEYIRLVQVLKNTREYHRWIKSFRDRLTSRRFKAVLEGEFESFVVREVSELNEKLLALACCVKQLPVISVSGSKLIRQGDIEPRFEQFVADRLGRSTFGMSIFPAMAGSVVVVTCLGVPLQFIDCYQANSRTREEVLDRALLFSIAMLYSLVKSRGFSDEFRRYCSVPDMPGDLPVEQKAGGPDCSG